MRFSDWAFLLILILLPLLFRWWVVRNRPAALAFSLPVPQAVGGKNPLYILLALKCLGIACLVLALARPQESFKTAQRTTSGIDIMLVMDVSASMNAEDLADSSRLDVAKQTMREFVEGRQDDRIGFVVFSGEPLTLAPLTLDYGLVLRQIREAEIGILKDGTGIGDGLSLAVSRLRESTAKSKVIILLTDGDNNVGQVDPATAGELAAGYGIRVYTIAAGREGRVRIPIRHRSVFGNSVLTYQWQDNALNPELLKLIASTTNGKFYRVTDASALAAVFKEINQLERTDVKAEEKVKHEEGFQLPLKLGALLLIIERLLAWGWWRLLI